MIGQHVLMKQLLNVGIFKETDTIAMFPDLHQAFRERAHPRPLSYTLLSFGSWPERLVWADNGDAVSETYGGSPAMKADFTRTGKRTLLGIIRDGQRALERYIRNRFFDYAKQVHLTEDLKPECLGRHGSRYGELSALATPIPLSRSCRASASIYSSGAMGSLCRCRRDPQRRYSLASQTTIQRSPFPGPDLFTPIVFNLG